MSIEQILFLAWLVGAALSARSIQNAVLSELDDLVDRDSMVDAALVGVVVALLTLFWFALVLFWLIGRDGDR